MRTGFRGRQAIPSRIRIRGSAAAALWVYALKIAVFGTFDAFMIWFSVGLARQGSYGMLASAAIGTILLNHVFLSERSYPYRYLLPGLIFMTAMVVYPLGYNVYISFTNYGTGNILSKQVAIQKFEEQTYAAPDSAKYSFELFADEKGGLRLVFTGPEGERYVSRGTEIVPVSEAEDVVDQDGDGQIDRVGDAVRVDRLQMLKYLGRLQQMQFTGDGISLKMASWNHFQELKQLYVYDPEKDAIINQKTGGVYYARDGYFTSPEGEQLLPGYRTAVGFRNYINLITNPVVSQPFLRVFAWTFIWAGCSVLLTFTLGLALALLLNDPFLRLKGFYRTILVIPYAIPSFVGALVWRGLFNTEFGQVNRFLDTLFGISIPWLQDLLWAKVAVLIVNLWLGFPYMMIICLGALQSIHPELYEAAYCDGATPRQQLRHITLPLLMVSLAPLLISSFAYNFNNFNVIYLVTRGKPPIPGANTPAGSTDILISYTYRLAFEGIRGADYGLAAAVSVLIFLIVGTITWFNFRYTRALEEVSENV